MFELPVGSTTECLVQWIGGQLAEPRVSQKWRLEVSTGFDMRTSLEKGLGILREVAASEQGMSIAEVAHEAKLNRTSAYRLCQILERGGWLHRLGDESEATRLDLGPAFHSLAVLVTSKYETESKLRPIMGSLSRTLSETVHLGVVEEDQVVHIAREIPDSGLQLAARLGSRAYAHASALGKSLLATLTDEEVRGRYSEEALPVFTPTTIASVSALIAEIHTIRERGYAIDDEESLLGVKCIAVPVFGASSEPLFAMSVTTVPQRLEGDSFTRVTEALRSAASLATASFGGVAPEIWRRSMNGSPTAE